VGLVQQFCTDPVVLGLFALTVCDLFAGVALAFKRDTFNWTILGSWYDRNMLPYVVAYIGPWLVVRVGLLPLIGADAGTLCVVVLAIPAAGALLESLRRNLLFLATPRDTHDTPTT